MNKDIFKPHIEQFWDSAIRKRFSKPIKAVPGSAVISVYYSDGHTVIFPHCLTQNQVEMLALQFNERI